MDTCPHAHVQPPEAGVGSSQPRRPHGREQEQEQEQVSVSSERAAALEKVRRGPRPASVRPGPTRSWARSVLGWMKEVEVTKLRNESTGGEPEGESPAFGLGNWRQVM